MRNFGHAFLRFATRATRRYLVGPGQRWVFEPPPRDWRPPHVERTTLYIHVPFCGNSCPYCPYTKVPYDETLLEPYTRGALTEVDWWASRIGSAEIASIYIGGGTPTLALGSVTRILEHVRGRFHVTGDICIETNPTDVNDATVHKLHDARVDLVSLGVQSFRAENLSFIGRRYQPSDAERALDLLVRSGFASVNVDIMFALPGQTASEVTADLAHAEQLGANQLTCYPLFTFPYSTVGQYLRLRDVRMPHLPVRRAHYKAINEWCARNGFERVSVWSFKRGAVPRYSSVTRDGYIGIGPGAGSHLPDGFVLNTFDLSSWTRAATEGKTAIALRMPFVGEMSGWWWFYWRLYDSRVPLDELNGALGDDAPKARSLLRAAGRVGLVARKDRYIELTEPGAFWIHLAQNHFALKYVNTLWTKARREPWPRAVAI